MDRLQVEDSIRIPTGVETDQYLNPSLNSSMRSVRSPSILVIASSPSPSKKSKFNNLQEVPKIQSRSRIPVAQRSTALPSTSSILRTNVHSQPLSVRADNQGTSSSMYNTNSYQPEHGMSDISASKNLPVLPAIGVNPLNQSSHSVKVPTGQPTIIPTVKSRDNQEVLQMPSAPKPYYHVTNTKPVFQMRAEYNNMLQNYQKHGANNQQTAPHLGQIHGTPLAPCRSCGRHVPQKHSGQSQSHAAHHHHYQPFTPANIITSSLSSPLVPALSFVTMSTMTLLISRHTCTRCRKDTVCSPSSLMKSLVIYTKWGLRLGLGIVLWIPG